MSPRGGAKKSHESVAFFMLKILEIEVSLPFVVNLSNHNKIDEGTEVSQIYI